MQLLAAEVNQLAAMPTSVATMSQGELLTLWKATERALLEAMTVVVLADNGCSYGDAYDRCKLATRRYRRICRRLTGRDPKVADGLLYELAGVPDGAA